MRIYKIKGEFVDRKKILFNGLEMERPINEKYTTDIEKAERVIKKDIAKKKKLSNLIIDESFELAYENMVNDYLEDIYTDVKPTISTGTTLIGKSMCDGKTYILGKSIPNLYVFTENWQLKAIMYCHKIEDEYNDADNEIQLGVQWYSIEEVEVI